MTTEAAARLYLAQHLLREEGRKWAIYNPGNIELSDLPVIYGFNNGGSLGWYSGQLIAEDGTALGGHICSHEDYMLNDLGIIEGSRPDRHESFREHYPDGYRMVFVSTNEVKKHLGLDLAYERNQEKAKTKAT